MKIKINLPMSVMQSLKHAEKVCDKYLVDEV